MLVIDMIVDRGRDVVVVVVVMMVMRDAPSPAPAARTCSARMKPPPLVQTSRAPNAAIRA